MQLNKEIFESVGYVMSLLKLELQSKLERQGYGNKTSSKLQQSMEYEVKAVATLIVAEMYMEDYYIYVEKPTPAERIPFGGNGRSGAKVSKYIQALFRFWKRRKGLSDKDALRASFATANIHKKEGRPSRGSLRYSKDGTRTGFIESTLAAYESKVFDILERRFGNTLEIGFTDLLREAFAA